MHIKLLYLYGVLQNVSFISSVSSDNIVRFTCNSCLKPETCCMGTLIQPNIVLTTSFCANLCQINKGEQVVPIVQVYEYPHRRKYLAIQNEKRSEFSNIALAVLDFLMSKTFVALSAMGPLSSRGLKVLIPVSTGRRLRFRSTVIQRCENAYTHSSGLHVCTGKTISDLKTCQQVQGAPSLLSDRVIGLSILHDCRLMQNIFIAVGPAVFWIRSIVEKVQKQQKQLVLRNAEPNSIEFSTSKTKCTRSKNSTDSVTTTIASKWINETATKREAYNLSNIITLVPKENITLGVNIKTATRTVLDSTNIMHSTNKSELSSTESTTPSSTGFPSESAMDQANIITLSNNSMPDAMNWFRLERSKLGNKPLSYLVLTSTRSFTISATNFVDLT